MAKKTKGTIDLNAFGEAFAKALHSCKDTRKYAADETEKVNEKTRFLGVPNLMFQAYLGRPGYALGRLHAIIGKEGAGKTSRLLWMINLAYATGRGIGGMIETEHALQDEQIESYIPQPQFHNFFRQKFLKKPDTFEDSLKLVIEMLETYKKVDPDNEFAKVIVYDTLAAIGTEREVDLMRETGDVKVADKAGQMTEFLKKILPVLESTQTLLVIGNQAKDRPDTSGGFADKYKPESEKLKAPGGESVNFHASYQEILTKVKKLPNNIGDGLDIKTKARKNKLRYPERQINYNLMFGNQRAGVYAPMDFVDATLEFLLMYEEFGIKKKNKNVMSSEFFMGHGDQVSADELYRAAHTPENMARAWPIIDVLNPYPENVFWPREELMAPPGFYDPKEEDEQPA